MTKKLLTDLSATGTITASRGLTLSGAAAPVTLNGSVGSSGQVLTSAGAGATPTWTTVSGGSFTGGTLTSDLILAAGSASVEPIRFQVNSVAPTATSGAMDYDGDKFFAVTSGTATGRLMVPAIAWAYSNANATAATTTTSQSIFQAGARALTLEAAKTYYFKLSLGFTIAFPAGGPFAVQFVPTFSQTPVAINYTAQCFGATSVNNYRVTSASATTVSPTYSSAASNQNLVIEGFFQSNATTGGTIEFKYQLNTGSPGGSATMNTGCYQQVIKIGTGAPAIISGAWA